MYMRRGALYGGAKCTLSRICRCRRLGSQSVGSLWEMGPSVIPVTPARPFGYPVAIIFLAANAPFFESFRLLISTSRNFYTLLVFGSFSYTRQTSIHIVRNQLTMATTMRLGSSALRTSLRAPTFTARSTAFSAVRCYSAKTQVCRASFASFGVLAFSPLAPSDL